ncbi:glycosyl transferase family protein [Sphingosinicella sp.]|uniref:glycosyl transferase family protein n=1 Tax=Sphingosinicella sp. TaxID=1917971 RepID=UPI0040384CB5
MGAIDLLFEALQLVLREASLFAAFGFVVLGIGDLVIDAAWLMLAIRRAFRPNDRPRVATNLPPARQPGRFAVFVPAWDEAEVIGGMLRHALAAFGGGDYRIYVGCYPNDPATIAAVRAVADPRVRLVVGPSAGPTSKADCLNRLWARMIADETAEGFRFKAVVLHDAEDIVHSAELPLFDSLIERFDLVQLPVVPLIDRRSRWIGGHYLDEFAEAHGKEMVVRAALRVGLPSAGVGCALDRDALAAIAAARGAPFDPDSLTEDYELGLRFREAGRTATFVRLPAANGRAVVATKGYFPTSLDAAVAQKARWMSGIALSGWDRLGWRGGLAERWMRLRDRQSVIAALLLAAAYLAILCGGLLALVGLGTEREMQPFSDTFLLLATLATGLLLWRLAVRFFFVARDHGWREAWRSPFRAMVGNAIAILAAVRALSRYNAHRRTGHSIWDKTAHAFPAQVPAE